jgi:hypothetical protein
VDIELPPGTQAEAFGARAHIRFEHAWEPLGDQIWRRLRQLQRLTWSEKSRRFHRRRLQRRKFDRRFEEP